MSEAGQVAEVRVGVVHYAAFPGSVDDASDYRHTLDLLFDDPAIQVVELSTVIPDVDVGAIARDARLSGTTLFLSAGPALTRPGAPSFADPASTPQALDASRRWLDLAVRLGAANLMLASGPAPAGAIMREVLPRLADVLAGVAEGAERLGGADVPTISLETYSPMIQPQQAIGATDVALEICDAIARRSPGFRLTVDLAHLAQLREDVNASLRTIGVRLRHVHLSTTVIQSGHPLYGDQHPSFRHPDVALDMTDLTNAIEVAFSFATSPLVISAEVRPAAGEDPHARWASTRRDLLSIVEHGRQAALAAAAEAANAPRASEAAAALPATTEAGPVP